MPSNNQLYALTTSISLSQNFAAASDGWSWGSSNAGPSGSRIVDSGIDAGKCLQLSGGSLGHFEQLQFLGFLDVRGSYALSYSIKADAGFASQPGDAGWYLQFFTSAGEAVRLLVSDASSATTWWQSVGPVTLDCAALAATSGMNSHVVRVGLLLVNAKYVEDGTASSSLYVTDIALSGTSTAEPYGYDANGNVTAAPARNLTTLTYEEFSGLVSSATLAGVEAQSVRYAYDAAGLRSAEVTDYGDGQEGGEKTLYLRDPYGNVLMRRTKSNGVESIRSYLPDVGGMLATHTAEGERYMLKDNLGSTCVEVSSTGDASASFAYGSFGESLTAPSVDALPYRYTGQEQDETLDIYNYNARLYDPALRRFYATDPAGQFPSPYVYVGNSPVNLVDPSGSQADFCRYVLYIRSFHPAASFGGGFHGDAATRSGFLEGFTTYLNVTSRVTQQIIFDACKMTIIGDQTYSNITRHWLGMEGLETPTGSVDFFRATSDKVYIKTAYSGENPLTPGPLTPAINIIGSFSIDLDRQANKLNIAANITGDAFPNTEVFITDPSGTGLFIGANVRAGWANDWAPLTLYGEADVLIMSTSFQAGLNPNGSFGYVVSDGRTYNISDWNQLQIERAIAQPGPWTWGTIVVPIAASAGVYGVYKGAPYIAASAQWALAPRRMKYTLTTTLILYALLSMAYLGGNAPNPQPNQ